MLIAAYMFVSSLLDLGVGALYGAGVLAVGVVLIAIARALRPTRLAPAE
jgi:hypothetical protein